MKVSVIIPSYNYGHFLSETLLCVQKQTLQDWECTIIDNGSTDSTKSIVADFMKNDNRFKYIYQDTKGVSHARNTGLQHALGSYIQFLDADDLIEKEKLSTAADLLDSRPYVDIVYSDARYFETESPLKLYFSLHSHDRDWMQRISGQGKPMINAFLKNNIFPINSPLTRKSILINNLFDEQLTLHEDWDLWLRVASSNSYFEYFNSSGTLALIRKHEKSASRNKAQMELFKLPIFLKSLSFSKLSLYQICYVILRYTEIFYDNIFNIIKLKKSSILFPSQIPVFIQMLLPIFLLLLLPVYLIIRLYRLIAKMF